VVEGVQRSSHMVTAQAGTVDTCQGLILSVTNQQYAFAATTSFFVKIAASCGPSR